MLHANRTLGTLTGLSLALVLTVGTQALGQTVKLERKFRPGTTCYIERSTETHNVTKGSFMGDSDETTVETFGLWEKTATGKDGKATLELTFDRLVQTLLEEDMEPSTYDTDNPDAPEAAIIYKTVFTPMLGKTLTIELDQNNQVTSFKGWPEITQAIEKAAVANMAWTKLQMSGEYSEDAIKRTWAEDPMLFYTNKEHKVGDTWETNAPFTSQGGGTINRTYQYKLEKIGEEDGHKVAIISYKETLSLKPVETEEQQGRRPQPKQEMSGTAVGEITYDIDQGRVIRNTGQGDVSVKVTYPPRREGAEPRVTTIDIEMKTTVRVLTEKARQAQKTQGNKKA